MSITSEKSINFKITQGETFAEQLQYVYEDESGNNIPIDITGFTFNLEVKDKPGGRVLAASCEIEDGITIVDATNGIIDLEIIPNKTNKFIYPRSAYQLNTTDQYGAKDVWLQGWFLVNPGVID